MKVSPADDNGHSGDKMFHFMQSSWVSIFGMLQPNNRFGTPKIWIRPIRVTGVARLQICNQVFKKASSLVTDVF